MTKYTIINSETNEFYPDPVYTELERAEKKVLYLMQYQQNNNMKHKQYGIEVLYPDREAQHNREWKRYCSMID